METGLRKESKDKYAGKKMKKRYEGTKLQKAVVEEVADSDITDSMVMSYKDCWELNKAIGYIKDTCVTLDSVGISTEGQTSSSTKWKAPLLFAGNWLPDYIDKGQVTRQRETLLEHSKHSVWIFCPEYFREQQEEMRTSPNPLFRFLNENTIYKESSQLEMAKIRKRFSASMMKDIKALDVGTIKQVNPMYLGTKGTVCKSCGNPLKSGCCPLYN
ncbi:hypothetical protein BDK51DRAFT_31992 [Blyttiomyces helicus]|uniref:Uncharacterized protein n=1 Tax=Blyttiomyces helicus TaxID=388810 RepID=A0A4P9W5R6_9FUNG|nr:hypothetical protein BDK51DRAFT_31992 [Blyttiomyces helicus]|eukprot:RKO86100.1 hypothetical protein BDK51DRAFT_31992 [Blyttiomyces helicus]